MAVFFGPLMASYPIAEWDKPPSGNPLKLFKAREAWEAFVGECRASPDAWVSEVGRTVILKPRWIEAESSSVFD